MKSQFCAIFLLCACISTAAFGQLKPGSLGLTTSFVENPNLGLVYAASEQTRFAATIGFNFVHDSVGNASAYHFGLSVWRYVLTSKDIATFVGGVMGVDAQSNTVGTTSLLDLGVLFGAEYWLSSAFAVHGSLQLHGGAGKQQGTPLSRFSTSAVSGMTWYF